MSMNASIAYVLGHDLQVIPEYMLSSVIREKLDGNRRISVGLRSKTIWLWWFDKTAQQCSHSLVGVGR